MTDHWDDFDVLRTLVSELRGRFPNLSPGQYDAVGLYLLKAFWLGEGQPYEDVLDQTPPPGAPHLRLIIGGRP